MSPDSLFAATYITRVNEEVQTAFVQGYPNPVKRGDAFRVEFDKPLLREFCLYDGRGRKVYTVSATSTIAVVSTDKLCSGIHFLVVTENGKAVSTQIVVIE